MVANFERSRDLYKVLQVPRTATMAEIKSSYRRLALKLHPDMHKDDPRKTAEFKSVSEAYNILSNEETKRTYDFKIGIRFNQNRRNPPPRDYRTVKHPPKPKHWKTVWDHETHYNMHYGDGMYQEVLRQARKRLEKQGYFDYKSPLGEGFTFSKSNPDLNHNPFSRSSRNRPLNGTTGASGNRDFSFDYEEGYVNMNGSSSSSSSFSGGVGGSSSKSEQGGAKSSNSGGGGGAKTFQRRTYYKSHFEKASCELHESRIERHDQEIQRRKAELRRSRENAAFSRRHDTCVIL